MTLEDIFRYDGKESFEIYAKRIDRIQKLEKKLHRLARVRDDEEDSMSVFSESEKNTPKYVEHERRYNKAVSDMQTCLTELQLLREGRK